VLAGPRAVVGWLGDSRAYHLGADGTVTPLTVDDSWATDQVEAGLLSEAEAQADRRAHVITRWLGLDAPDITPTVAVARLGPGDRLLLCSDGLWNYAETPEALAGLLRSGAGRGPLDLARSLVDYARSEGGHDNITVALAHVDAAMLAAADLPDERTADLPDERTGEPTGELSGGPRP
jgi:serine/threonine protein phosphatase PrpC